MQLDPVSSELCGRDNAVLTQIGSSRSCHRSITSGHSMWCNKQQQKDEL